MLFTINLKKLSKYKSFSYQLPSNIFLKQIFLPISEESDVS